MARGLLYARSCCRARSRPRLVTARGFGYLGGMVTQRAATVSRGQILIRDVDLPEGTEVHVQIMTVPREIRFIDPDDDRLMAEAFRESDRGEGVSAEEALATFRRESIERRRAMVDAIQAKGAKRPAARRPVVARKSRAGAKSRRRRTG